VGALTDLLFLILLASMAKKTKRSILSGIMFGFLKALSLYLIHVTELNTDASFAATISATHLVPNTLLGIAIAFIVVKHSKNPEMVVVMTILSIPSFLSRKASLNVTNLS